MHNNEIPLQTVPVNNNVIIRYQLVDTRGNNNNGISGDSVELPPASLISQFRDRVKEKNAPNIVPAMLIVQREIAPISWEDLDPFEKLNELSLLEEDVLRVVVPSVSSVFGWRPFFGGLFPCSFAESVYNLQESFLISLSILSRSQPISAMRKPDSPESALDIITFLTCRGLWINYFKGNAS